MRFAASSNEMFHLLLFAIGSNEFVLVAHDLVSGAVTANRHSHGDCQHPACIMLLGYHWADVLPLQPLIGRLRHYLGPCIRSALPKRMYGGREAKSGGCLGHILEPEKARRSNQERPAVVADH